MFSPTQYRCYSSEKYRDKGLVSWSKLHYLTQNLNSQKVITGNASTLNKEVTHELKLKDILRQASCN